MKNTKPNTPFGNTTGTPFNFDLNKDSDAGHTMIFAPTRSSKSKDGAAAYATLGLSDAEFEIIKNGRL